MAFSDITLKYTKYLFSLNTVNTFKQSSISEHPIQFYLRCPCFDVFSRLLLIFGPVARSLVETHKKKTQKKTKTIIYA